MRFDWFHPRKLAQRLIAGGVSNQEVAYLMLSNLLFGSVVFYGAFTWANPPWTLLSLIEFFSVVIITFIGFTKVYDAAGGDKNNSFAALFNCLSFGVWVWVTAIVWSVYWMVVWGFHYGALTAYRFDRLALATNLAEIGGSFEWLWTYLAAVLWQLLYFTWLARVIPRAHIDA
jgi:hypothetical protein